MTKALLFSLHKCGTTLLSRILQDVAREGGHRLVSVSLPRHGAVIRGAGGFYAPLFAEGDLFGPIRRFEPPPPGARCVVHLRDPRDLLTSLYYSVSRSHPLLPDLPERLRISPGPLDQAERDRWCAAGIDAFVLAAAPLFRTRFQEYLDALPTTGATLVTYEDMVGDFAGWAGRTFTALGLPDHVPAVVERFAGAVAPPREDPGAHVRKVTPGDHRDKLAPDTVAALEAMFAGPLRALGRA